MWPNCVLGADDQGDRPSRPAASGSYAQHTFTSTAPAEQQGPTRSGRRSRQVAMPKPLMCAFSQAVLPGLSQAHARQKRQSERRSDDLAEIPSRHPQKYRDRQAHQQEYRCGGNVSLCAESHLYAMPARWANPFLGSSLGLPLRGKDAHRGTAVRT